MSTADARFRAWVPFALVFAAGTAVMVVELVAARIVARHIGASLYTWTAIIGVVLAGLAVGNGLGGALADRFRAERLGVLLSALFALASVCAFSILWTHWHVFDLAGDWGWQARILTGSLLAFLVPAIVLGTVSPVVGKWAVLHSHALGHTLGGLYAWGSLGAIAGTLLTGFVLIPFFGTVAVIAVVAFALAAIAVPLHPCRWSLGWLLCAAALTLVVVAETGWPREVARAIGVQRDTGELYFDETAYQAIEVRGDRFGVRGVMLDGLYHGYVDPVRPDELHYAYLEIVRALVESHSGERPALLALGGGSYTFPRWFAHTYPGARILVAEIDPGVTLANLVATDLPLDPGFDIVHRDARIAVVELLERGERFDFIFGDTFRDWTVPAHLTTLEFHQQLRGALADDGVLMTNVIDDFRYARMLGAYYNTVAAVFEHVAVFATVPPDGSAGRDTFVVAASRVPLDAAAVQAAAVGRGRAVHPLDADAVVTLVTRSGGRVLTDDHAPVEHLLRRVMAAQQR